MYTLSGPVNYSALPCLFAQKRRACYIITYRGRPVGLLSPLEDQGKSRATSSGSTAWDELTRLGKEPFNEFGLLQAALQLSPGPMQSNEEGLSLPLQLS